MRNTENARRPDAGNPENPETENDGAEGLSGAFGVAGEDGLHAAEEDIDIPDYVVRDFDGGKEEARFVDARQAAEMLGTSRRDVREMAARGWLDAKEEGGAASRLAVSVASVRSLVSENPDE